MLVPGKIYGDQRIVDHLMKDAKGKGKEWNALEQIKNVACLPGIVKASIAMPDVHPGYGFPIGGVGAFTVEEGVVAMGGVGFDVNCLTADAKILNSLGYWQTIGSMRPNYTNEQLICQDFNDKKTTKTPVIFYIERSHQGSILHITTAGGYKIKVTPDHPLWTPTGMVEACLLKAGDRVAIYPFEGVPYESSIGRVIINDEHIKEFLAKHGKINKGNAPSQIIRHLKEKGLLPLRTDSPNFPYLIKILGAVFGDGNIYFVNDIGKGRVSFYGNPEDLEDIRDDIILLGFSSPSIHSREREHLINTLYGKVKFSRQEHSLHITSSSLAALLGALGAPIGNKSAQDYTLPEWLFELPLWQKRLFLAALFGAELSTPKTLTGHDKNFYTPILCMNKHEGHVESGISFLKGIATLLEELGVKVLKISKRKKYIGKDGMISYRLRLIIGARPGNLIKLWTKIGFEYNQHRSFLGNVAAHYLKYKLHYLEGKCRVLKEAQALVAVGAGVNEVVSTLSEAHIKPRQVQAALNGDIEVNFRATSDFPTFSEFLIEVTENLGTSGMVWDTIESIESANYEGPVYDFTVAHHDHNFIANSFVVSNCGVRTLKTPFVKKDVEERKEELANRLFKEIPAGLGSEGELRLSLEEIDQVLLKGAKFSIERGYGLEEDLEFIEEGGCIEGADPSTVSLKAKQRQFKQVGTLGSGNHYLEVQYIAEIYDEEAAKAYGIFKDQILIAIHCGSRALGHQIGQDSLKDLEKASRKYGIPIRERELVCAPIESPEGKRYISAVNCGINCAFANRQALAHLARKAFKAVFGGKDDEIKTLYDVGHNIAKFEFHEVNGQRKKLLVHRKGATRAFGPGREENPLIYRKVGHPIFIGGTMGTCSYIMRGTEKGLSEVFGSGIHGAGREMSRQKAKKEFRGEKIRRKLKEEGIIIRAHSMPGVAEEAPGAYKDINMVADAAYKSGINQRVAKVKPLVVVKG
jgi:tRNA-splicing ligase RtcB